MKNYFKQLFQYNKAERIGLIILLLLLTFVVGGKYATWKKTTKEDKTPPPKKEIYQQTKEETTKKETKKSNTPILSPKKRVPVIPKHPQKKSTHFVSNKLKKGTVVELNKADTLLLKKIPGIGSVFANRIVKYRKLLGGYLSIEQLKEVYGIDQKKWQQLQPWFKVDRSLVKTMDINKADFHTLLHHPYISYEQTKLILQIRKREGLIKSWEKVALYRELDSTFCQHLKGYLIIKKRTHKKK